MRISNLFRVLCGELNSVKEKIPKILIYSSILIVSIYLFVSIVKDYTAHVFLSEYKESLKEEEGGYRTSRSSFKKVS